MAKKRGMPGRRKGKTIISDSLSNAALLTTLSFLFFFYFFQRSFLLPGEKNYSLRRLPRIPMFKVRINL